MLLTLKERIKADCPRVMELYRRAYFFANKWKPCYIRERWKLGHCLRNGQPYFGPIYAAAQGDPLRHAYMNQLIRSECANTSKEDYFGMLEIGSWAGGSAITWGASLKKYHEGDYGIVCVDPWKDPITNTEPANVGMVLRSMSEAGKKDRIMKLFTHNIASSDISDVVLPIRGLSKAILPLLRPNQFNLIFVDGSHRYQDVLNDLNQVSPLLKEQGILCGDDLELQLHQISPHLRKGLPHMGYIPDPQSNVSFHPGVTRAVGEFFGDVSVQGGFWAMRKNNTTWVKVEIPSIAPETADIPHHLQQRWNEILQTSR